MHCFPGKILCDQTTNQTEAHIGLTTANSSTEDPRREGRGQAHHQAGRVHARHRGVPQQRLDPLPDSVVGLGFDAQLQWIDEPSLVLSLVSSQQLSFQKRFHKVK